MKVFVVSKPNRLSIKPGTFVRYFEDTDEFRILRKKVTQEGLGMNFDGCEGLYYPGVYLHNEVMPVTNLDQRGPEYRKQIVEQRRSW